MKQWTVRVTLTVDGDTRTVNTHTDDESKVGEAAQNCVLLLNEWNTENIKGNFDDYPWEPDLGKPTSNSHDRS